MISIVLLVSDHNYIQIHIIFIVAIKATKNRCKAQSHNIIRIDIPNKANAGGQQTFHFVIFLFFFFVKSPSNQFLNILNIKQAASIDIEQELFLGFFSTFRFLSIF